MGGAGVGAYIGGPPGAAIGDVVADSLFENGKSGAVRIGISPTERIILSPKAAAASRGLLTQFLKAKATGQTAAMTAAYNSLAKRNGDNQPDSADQSQTSPSSGGSPIGAVLAGANFDHPSLSGPVGQQTLSQVLDEYESAPPAKRKSMEPKIYQQIIRFRSRLASNMDEDEKMALEKRVASYSNALVKKRR